MSRGKSTLLLEVAHRWAAAGSGGPSLYVTGEESAGQVRLRAERTDSLHPELYLGSEADLGAVFGHVDAIHPGLLIIDSVQTVQSPDVDGTPGGVTQVRAVTSGLVALAKERGLPVVLVGHVTKDGAVAGPRAPTTNSSSMPSSAQSGTEAQVTSQPQTAPHDLHCPIRH